MRAVDMVRMFHMLELLFASLRRINDNTRITVRGSLPKGSAQGSACAAVFPPRVASD